MTADGSQHSSSRTSFSALSRKLALVLSFFALAAAMQWRNGAYSAGFGFHPDEPAHYVTGLMVYKYLMTAIGTNPMAFAERFYAHYPAVAFGHWPPLFYVLQAGWEVLFGPSRASVLVLLALLAAITSLLIYHSTEPRLGWVYALPLAALFILTPLVQQHTASVMAELPLTLFTFAVTLSLTSLLAAPTWKRAIGFALCLGAAILTKGDGWALIILPFIVPLITLPLRLIPTKYLMVAVIVALAGCAPVTLLTLKMTRDGWDQPNPSVSFFANGLPTLASFHVSILGLPLILLACAGAFITVLWPLLSHRRPDTFWASNSLLVICVLLFHALVPTSLESRKIFMSLPSLLVLAGAGLEFIISSLPVRGHAPVLRSSCVLIAMMAIAAQDCWKQAVRPYANSGHVAQAILDQKTLDRTAVLVASGARDERDELSFVAELAGRERGDLQHAVVRAGKFMADSSWLGSGYKLRYSDPVTANAALAEIPIAAIILCKTHDNDFRTPHSVLIEQVVDANRSDWRLDSSEISHGRLIELFRSTQPSKPVQLPPINLSRKLGHVITGDF